MYQFVELPLFTKKWSELELTDQDLRQLQNAIIQQPNTGADLGSGLFKIRHGIAGRGKRGGIRVIYADHRQLGVIFLLVCYSKNDIDNITPTQQQQLATVSAALKQGLLTRKGK